MARTAVLNIRIDSEHGFPFSLKQPRFNAETEQAIRDAQAGVDLHRCDSVEQLFNELDGE